MDECVQHLFEAQAVVSPFLTLTFGELNRRANQLPYFLSNMGVGRNQVVAIRMEFCPDLFVALLATLKAGAAYLPIDFRYPAERARASALQLKSALLLAHSHLNESLGIHSLALERLRDLEALPISNPPWVSTPSDPVYCIFTSRSTGMPKGALNLHRGFSNICDRYGHEELGGGPGLRTLVMSSFGFDLTQKNLFEPLVHGGTVVLGGATSDDHLALRSAIQMWRPTRVNCSPSAFDAFKGLLHDADLSVVVLGGEPVSRGLALSIIEGGPRLVNSYSPAECSDVAMFHIVEPVQGDAVPLGQPTPNAEIFLVDEIMQLVTEQGEGEILIGGVGVGAGYVGQPELTQERFVANTLGTAPHIVYRTVDRALRIADGSLWYVGRRDRQMKILGNRLELGEIEAAILGHQSVRAYAVVADRAAGQREQLIAFVVADAVSVASLQEYWSDQLPDFMVPRDWRFHDCHSHQ